MSIPGRELLIGNSGAIRGIQQDVRRAARCDAKVLLTGESGVGKEVVARLIHGQSTRSRAPLVAMNCAGVPDALLESELFGHRRGSFTGAYRDQMGLLEQAGGGTVFMDEVGEMSLRMQALLLRFLETGELQRVGADLNPRRVDVRVIAATNRDLADRIAAGAFREDLFYRLNVIHISIPSLRERREDIVPLLEWFLRTTAERYGVTPPQIEQAARAALEEYDWPGNARELRNLAERVLARGHNGPVTRDDLPPAVRRGSPTTPPPADASGVDADALFNRMVTHAEPFWSAVYEPFMMRDLRREDLRRLVRRGLKQTQGSYTRLVRLFNMPASDYKRFMSLLRKHDCHVAFQPFRSTVDC